MKYLKNGNLTKYQKTRRSISKYTYPKKTAPYGKQGAKARGRFLLRGGYQLRMINPDAF